MLDSRASAGLRVGSAPDTVLGTGIQTARALLDAGTDRRTRSAPRCTGVSRRATSSGTRRPQFYYQPGGGPLFDMGPYYLTSLVTLFGPVVASPASSTRSDRQRTIATGAERRRRGSGDVDTHVTRDSRTRERGDLDADGQLRGVGLARAAVRAVWNGGDDLGPRPEPVLRRGRGVRQSTRRNGRRCPSAAGYADAGRGFGLADMAHAIETDRPHRASGDLAFHVLEIMDAVMRAAAEHTRRRTHEHRRTAGTRADGGNTQQLVEPHNTASRSTPIARSPSSDW